MNKKVLEFKELFEVNAQSGNIKADCNSFTIINIGATNINFNGFILARNEQYTSAGNAYEKNTSIYNVGFPSASGQYLVIRKTYN